jgi:hypothetical protein
MSRFTFLLHATHLDRAVPWPNDVTKPQVARETRKMASRSRRRPFLAVGIAILVAACGGSTVSPAASTSPSPATPAPSASVAAPTLGATLAPILSPTPATDNGDIHLIKHGYFAPGFAGATYVPVSPTRVLDTRAKLGLTASLPSGTGVTFTLTGAPAGAVAVTGNLTEVSNYAGTMVLDPTTTLLPTTSTINFPARDTRANGVTLGTGPGGTLWLVFNGPRGVTADAIFDVSGYFLP